MQNDLANLNKPEIAIPHDQGKTPVIAKYQRMEASSFSGPLPHPEILAKYNQIIPNGAERIMCMAEKQMNHRMGLDNEKLGMDKMILESDIRRSDRGVIFGFVIAILIILGGFGLILAGIQVIGIVAIITPLISIIGIFVYTERSRKIDEEEKTHPKKNTKSQKPPPSK